MPEHGGNLRELAGKANREAQEILDFSANINPLGPPEWLRPVISRSIERLVQYPDPDSAELVEAVAAQYRVSPDQIVVGNGSTDILFALARAFTSRRAVIPVPSYIDYVAASRLAGLAVEPLDLHEDEGFVLNWSALARQLRGQEIVFLGQPNNPTGLLLDRDELCEFAETHSPTIFVVDEAFADFVEGYQTLARERLPNIIALRSLTKFYAIPGLRLGLAMAEADLATQIRTQLPPWSVNTLAQSVGTALVADGEYGCRTRRFVAEERERLTRELGKLPGLYVYPGVANYLLVRVDESSLDAVALAERLSRDGIAIRTFDAAEQLDNRFFRVAVRTREENGRLCAVLANALGGPRLGHRKKRAAALMIQGTGSNAGKSVLTAALCRILLQDGIRVAPFKSQNMSLNSFVTRDGGEMGRAQVVQAQASRLEPDVRMNPILLKPNSDTGCQVIVRGKPVGNMNVAGYIDYKPQAFEAAKQCYDSLASEFDAIIMEGAGSPGEVNLKHHDIVNMPMAAYADAPVVIVGDIDRGGVFASFVGTMEVLAHWERAMVAGWVVNRFRGDESLLDSALDYTKRHTGRPVLGVVPYVSLLNLPQEDSVESWKGTFDEIQKDRPDIEIAVIALPHISNFTDFDPFGVETDVRLRIVRSAAELDRPDAVIIPGSKATLSDMNYLRQSGLAERIARLAAENKSEIVGICAGFQMLGHKIQDPDLVESSDGGVQGLGLLKVDTVMLLEKTLLRTSARHSPSGVDVSGYEIHHGQTNIGQLVPAFVSSDGQVVGAARPDHRVWGTYLHGVFDSAPFRRWFIDRLRVQRGLAPHGESHGEYEIEPAMDRWADVVRQSLKMDEIYRLMQL